MSVHAPHTNALFWGEESSLSIFLPYLLRREEEKETVWAPKRGWDYAPLPPRLLLYPQDLQPERERETERERERKRRGECENWHGFKSCEKVKFKAFAQASLANRGRKKGESLYYSKCTRLPLSTASGCVTPGDRAHPPHLSGSLEKCCLFFFSNQMRLQEISAMRQVFGF